MNTKIDGTIAGQVSAAKELRSGIGKNNKPWTLFEVILDGQKYTTFDRQFIGEVGKPARDYGYQINNWTDKSGNAHSDKVLVELQRTQAVPAGTMTSATPLPQGQVMEKLFTKLDRMEKMIEKIGGMVSTLAPEDETPPLASPDEINPEEIPF